MNKTVVLDLDSLDRTFMHQLMAEGQLPNLSRLMEQSTYWPLQNESLFIAEIAHSVFYTGQKQETMQYWGAIKYDVEQYQAHQASGLTPETGNRLFWELKDKARVTVLDNPQTWISKDCQGTQIYGWGYHGPKGEHGSSPEGLIPQLQAKYGSHQAFPKDNANLTKPETVYDLAERLIQSARIRTEITLDLLENTEWDLFVGSFSETHSTPHYVFGASYIQKNYDLERLHKAHVDIYREADSYVGRIMDKLDPDTNLMVLSVEGMQSNNQDIPSTVLLPEWLYRWNFPGHIGLRFPDEASTDWPETNVWRTHLLPYLGRARGLSYLLRRFLKPMDAVRWEERLSLTSVPFHPRHFKDYSYLVAMWYQPLWQRMKAFAIPSFSDGAIRLNVQGRDPHGLVAPDEYDAVCEELTEMLQQLTLPGSNIKAATRITRTRKHPMDPEGPSPSCDLAITWHPDIANKLVCPRYGTFGPVCPMRFGAHNADGFLMARGPGFEAGVQKASAKVIDLAPTALDLLGVEHDMTFDGNSLAPSCVTT